MLSIDQLIDSKDYQAAYVKLKELEWNCASNATYDLLFALAFTQNQTLYNGDLYSEH
mgnify:CR=1 FL=1